jgi:hypothetical protein
MVQHGLYMANGKGCHSYLRGHVNDSRPWCVISDETNTLKVCISWSGVQYVRYESGWSEEHKVKDFSRPIPYANTIKREWMSEIDISGDHLRFWDEVMVEDDNLATFNVEYDSSDIMLASGAVYSTGVGGHSDPDNKPRSALLIVHNDGFLVQQKGLSQEQSVGKILILHTHEPHSLTKVNAVAQKWAAVFLDYEDDLSLKAIEESLKDSYLRVFGNG